MVFILEKNNNKRFANHFTK